MIGMDNGEKYVGNMYAILLDMHGQWQEPENIFTVMILCEVFGTCKGGRGGSVGIHPKKMIYMPKNMNEQCVIVMTYNMKLIVDHIYW